MRITRPIGALAALAAMLLAGCISPAGIEPRARLLEVQALGAAQATPPVTPAAWPAADWWRALGDAQLGQLIEEATRGNPTMGQARARVDAALAAVTLAGAKLGLANAFEAGATRQRFTRFGTSVNYAGRSFTQYDLAAVFGFEPDFWDRQHSALAAELGRLQAAETETHAVRLALAGAVAMAYSRLQLHQEQLLLAHAALERQEALVAHLDARHQGGFDPAAELALAQATLPEQQAHLAGIEQARALARNQLAALLGKGPEHGRDISAAPAAAVPPAVPAILPATLVGRRPDIVAGRWRVEAASRDIAAARAGFYPNINIAAYVGLQSIGFGNLLRSGSQVFGLAPAINLPIFGGATLKGTLAARNAGYDLAVEQYNQLVIEALHQVADQLDILRGLERQITETEGSLAREQAAQALAAARYAGGLDNRLPQLSIEARLQARQMQLAELRHLRRQAVIQLMLALGGGFSPEPLPASGETP